MQLTKVYFGFVILLADITPLNPHSPTTKDLDAVDVDIVQIRSIFISGVVGEEESRGFR